MKKLCIPNFKGVFMRDEILKEKPSRKECFIYNIDSSENEGTHWVAVSINNNKCWYFDSYGFPPTLEIQKYLKHMKDRHYNTFEIQKPGEVICGQYSLYVLHRLAQGISFYDVLDELYKFSFYNKK